MQAAKRWSHQIFATVLALLAVAWVTGLVLFPADRRAQEQEAWALVTQGLEQVRNGHYSGVRETVLFEAGRPAKTYVHEVFTDGKRQRLTVREPAAEAGRTSVRTETEIRDYYPDLHRLVVSHYPRWQTAGPGLLEETAACDRNGTHALLGEVVPVLGRSAQVVTVRCSASGVEHRYWVDQGTRLILQVEDYEGRQLVQRGRFRQVSFSPEYPPGCFELPTPAGCQVVETKPTAAGMTLATAEKAAGLVACLPRQLPAGYRLLEDQVGVVRIMGRPVLWLKYSDGVEVFSLFQCPASMYASLNPRCCDRYAWRSDTHCFLVAGRISAAELQKMKDSTLCGAPAGEATSPPRS